MAARLRAAAILPESIGGGRYKVALLLGEGGSKTVYLAHDQTLDRDVALALFKTEGLDATARVRVIREARAMAGLGDHPHIVNVYDVGEEAGRPYLVSQYMRGGSVDDLMRKHPHRRLPLEQVLRIADEVCQALEYAHARGVIHRDLKPANVFLTQDGNAKLGDFGLAIAQNQSRVTADGVLVGTAAYLPPEQALGAPLEPRSDIYSLGAMLYEMVTGRPPFVGETLASVISQHLNAAPIAPSALVSDLNAALDAPILRALAKTPAARPHAAELRRELNRSTPPKQASMEMLASSVVAERPDLKAHAAPDGTVTILFSDIENYTALTERLGDLRAQQVLHAHNRIIREQLRHYQGYEVKSLGDGFMMVFSSARRALLCAIEIQRAFAEYDRDHADEPIMVRMGLHTGETIRESGDFYGKAVILAARIGAAAHAGEILVSQTFKEVTQSAGDIRYDEGQDLVLKGLSGTHRVYRILSPTAAVCPICNKPLGSEPHACSSSQAAAARNKPIELRPATPRAPEPNPPAPRESLPVTGSNDGGKRASLATPVAGSHATNPPTAAPIVTASAVASRVAPTIVESPGRTATQTVQRTEGDSQSERRHVARAPIVIVGALVSVLAIAIMSFESSQSRQARQSATASGVLPPQPSAAIATGTGESSSGSAGAMTNLHHGASVAISEAKSSRSSLDRVTKGEKLEQLGNLSVRKPVEKSGHSLQTAGGANPNRLTLSRPLETAAARPIAAKNTTPQIKRRGSFDVANVEKSAEIEETPAASPVASPEEVAMAAPPTPLAPPEFETPIIKMSSVERINHWRRIAGLPEITEDQKQSDREYAESANLLHRLIAEDRWASSAGLPNNDAQAASIIGFTGMGVDSTGGSAEFAVRTPPQAQTGGAIVDTFMSLPLNSLRLLDPQLTRIGTGFQCQGDRCAGEIVMKRGLAKETRLGLYEPNPGDLGWNPALGPMPPSRARLRKPVEFPPNGSTIPMLSSGLDFDIAEFFAACPDYTPPTGFPISFQLGQGIDDAAEPVVSAHSVTHDGQAVTHCLVEASTFSGHDPSSALARAGLYMFGAIILVPKDPLLAGATYQVSITADDVQYSWSFRTAPR